MSRKSFSMLFPNIYYILTSFYLGLILVSPGLLLGFFNDLLSIFDKSSLFYIVPAIILLLFFISATVYLMTRLIFIWVIVSLEPGKNNPFIASFEISKGKFWRIFICLVPVAIIYLAFGFVFRNGVIYYLIPVPICGAFGKAIVYAMYMQLKNRKIKRISRRK